MNNNNLLVTGLILGNKKTKIYNHWPNCSPANCQVGCRYGKETYKLKVKLENDPIKIISIFLDKLTQPDKILTTLKSKDYIDKRYLFTCLEYFGK
ncbi:MAG: hypothetical protein GBAus27B_000419 [Mycoplasmataceae bacterium]|nr:MAG: hypothetical protein GBAus27B_000419 [Mycoplasmataceae bacterium]